MHVSVVERACATVGEEPFQLRDAARVGMVRALEDTGDLEQVGSYRRGPVVQQDPEPRPRCAIHGASRGSAKPSDELPTRARVDGTGLMGPPSGESAGRIEVCKEGVHGASFCPSACSLDGAKSRVWPLAPGSRVGIVASETGWFGGRSATLGIDLCRSQQRVDLDRSKSHHAPPFPCSSVGSNAGSDVSRTVRESGPAAIAGNNQPGPYQRDPSACCQPQHQFGRPGVMGGGHRRDRLARTRRRTRLKCRRRRTARCERSDARKRDYAAIKAHKGASFCGHPTWVSRDHGPGTDPSVFWSWSGTCLS